MAIGSALSVGLIGLKAFIIQIQAFVSPDFLTSPSSGFPTPRFPKRGNVSNPHAKLAAQNGRRHELRSIFRRHPCPNAVPLMIWRSQRAYSAHLERYPTIA